jgi:hypothetical protein
VNRTEDKRGKYQNGEKTDRLGRGKREGGVDRPDKRKGWGQTWKNVGRLRRTREREEGDWGKGEAVRFRNEEKWDEDRRGGGGGGWGRLTFGWLMIDNLVNSSG